ncbi:MAG TPA: tetratricopeptide repeat protein, partial [Thermoanaerobaculia bacterium]|nr:tetratricopeptide repeat protein [Thermoanaerobaculia bacterium]
MQGCLDLVSTHRYEAAVRRCPAVFESNGDARAGVAVVRAHYSLGHDEEVVAWVDRLAKAGTAEPGVWSMAGAVHQKRGRIKEAERAYRSDLAVCRATADHRHAADSLLRLFNLSRGRAGYHETFLLASEHLQEAAKTGDPALRARAAEALYVVLFDAGDLAAARRALEATQAWAGALDPKAQARFLNNMGTVLAAEGRVALARRDFERALELGAGGTEELLRSVHLNLAEILLDLGDVEQASQHLAAAWRHAEPGQAPETSLLDYRARIALARGNLPEAAQALTAALSSHPEPEWAWDLEYRRGLLAEARGDPRAAEEAYEKSIGIVEDMRRSLAFDELKTWLLDRQREPFEALFRLQARSGRARDALA